MCSSVQHINQAINSPSKSIAGLRRDLGEAFVTDFYYLALMELVRDLKVSDPMSLDQVSQTAYDLQKEFWQFKPADVRLCFTRIKTGYYGTIFNRVDISTIGVCMRKYFEERCAEAERMSQKSHEYFIEDKDTEKTAAQIAEIYAKSFSLYEKQKQELKTEKQKEIDYEKWKSEYYAKGKI